MAGQWASAFNDMAQAPISEGELETSPSMLSLSCTCRSVESLLLTAQQQQLRHLRRLQQLRRQAESNVAMQSAWEEKQAAEEQRKAAREAEAREAQLQRAARSRDVGARNAAAQAAAGRAQEQWHAALQAKHEAARRRADNLSRQRGLISSFARAQVARSEARRQDILACQERELEERRLALAEKQAREEEGAQRRQELRDLHEQIRREEEALAAARRGEARRRAEEEEEARHAHYEWQMALREMQAAEHKQDADARRAAGAEEARLRAGCMQQRSAQAAAEEAARQKQLEGRLQDKMSKVDAILAQRAALAGEVRRAQASMRVQENRMKEALGQMQRTGRLTLPREILDCATRIEAGALAAAAAAAGSSACATWGGGGGATPRWSASLGEQEGHPAGPGGRGSSGGGVAASWQEAELQRVLEEEILMEVERERALSQVAGPERRRLMMQQYDQEREAAKARILAVGASAEREAR